MEPGCVDGRAGVIAQDSHSDAKIFSDTVAN
jgi:hypothetical protein